MGLYNGSLANYYGGLEDTGSYQFISVTDIINNFRVAYVGEDKIIPKISRANEDSSLSPKLITKSYKEKVINLKKIAAKRNQTISQMALSWVLRHKEITSALIGARTLKQLDECLDSLNNLNFTKKELKTIDKFAKEENINLWSASSKN